MQFRSPPPLPIFPLLIMSCKFAGKLNDCRGIEVYQLCRRAVGFFLAIVRSRSAVLCGRREPCSQLCTAFGLTQRKCANTAWLACRLSRICRISCGLRTLGGAGISFTRKSSLLLVFI